MTVLKKHMKVRPLVLILTAVISLGLVTGAVMAKSDVPPPYAGLKNPFSWTDTTAQAQGKSLYQKACAGCHGAGGANLAGANFAAPDFSNKLETEADYYFWMVSEGRLKDGMPPFKSTVTETERWQILTYLWTLSKMPQPVASSSPATPILGGGPMFPSPTITMAVDNSSPTPGLTMTASLIDSNGKPVSGQEVEFFLKKSFFATDWMQIGEAPSNNQGKAVINYLPSEDGVVQLSARWENLEATKSFTVRKVRSYQSEAGIRLPAIGPEVAVGLDVAQAELGEASPTGGLRFPGGTLSWLLLFDAVIILVWITYFRVFRLVMHIPEAHGQEGLSVRLVPFLATGFVLVMGVVLALVILHGPYTHLHLGR